MRMVAAVYHMNCRRTICVRIFRGGNSVNAPGRGGRRLRTILWAICGSEGRFYKGSIGSFDEVGEVDGRLYDG